MKRKGLIAVLAAMMVMMSVVFSFAAEDEFKLTSSYPSDGQKNTSMENVGVKLYFNHSISGDEAKANNENCVRILDPDGNAIPVKILTSDDSSGLMLVLGDSTDENFTVQNNAEYTLVIDEGFMDDEGNTLGAAQKITFQTFNQRLNSIINMGMMFIMFGGIMFATIRQQNQQNQQKKEEKNEKKENFNPYREAKKTGKSVEEVIEEEKKRQEKASKKAKKNKEPEQISLKGMNLSDILPNVYHVHAPKPIRAAGGKYRTARGIAAAEAAAAKKAGRK